MTTGVGFKCSDGIVLATDTQHTGDWKMRGEKLFEIGGLDAIKLCVAGSGPVSLIRKAVENIGKGVLQKNITTVDNAQKLVEDVLATIYSKYIDTFVGPEDQRPFLQLLVGTWVSPNSIELFATDRIAVVPVSDYEVIGTGGLVVQYIMETARSLNSSVADAKHMALYAIKMAKDFDQYSGKETRLKTLMLDGKMETASPQEIGNAESCFDTLFDAIRLLVTAMTTEIVTDGELDEFVDSIGLKDTLRAFRDQERQRKEQEQRRKQGPVKRFS